MHPVRPWFFQKSRGSLSCDDCPAGRFMNSTGEGVECDACPRGRSTNGGTAHEVCQRCSDSNTPAEDDFDPITVCGSKMQCGQVGGDYFFQDRTGAPTCDACPNSGHRGAFGCNEKNGDIQCYGLYLEKSKCRRAQMVIEFFAVAVVTFVLSIKFLIPAIFFSGLLAVVSRQWRKDLLVVLRWMRRGTSKGNAADAAELAVEKATTREENIAEGFRRMAIDGRVTLGDLGPLLKAHLSLDERKFLGKLTEILNVDAQEIFLDYTSFRGFLSLTAQRLEFAKQQKAASCAYRDEKRRAEVKSAPASISAADAQKAASKMGFDLSSLEKAAAPTRRRIASELRVSAGGGALARANGINVGGAPTTAESDASDEDMGNRMGDGERARVGHNDGGADDDSDSDDSYTYYSSWSAMERIARAEIAAAAAAAAAAELNGTVTTTADGRSGVDDERGVDETTDYALITP